MKINKFNTINENYKKDFYVVEMTGEFDLKNIEFDSVFDAMTYLNNNYNNELLLSSYDKGYKIFKIQKELVGKDTVKDILKMMQNSNKYNL